MTPEQTVNLKVGDVVYIVAMSHGYDLYNPFIRTCKAGRSKYYKPLGVFKTNVCEIKEKTNNGGSLYINGNFDSAPLEHIIWRSRYDELPEGKKITDYVGYEFASDNFWGNFKNIFGDNNNTNNVFFDEDEAKAYYDKELKKFNKNIKQYIARLKNEIEAAQREIGVAKKEIDRLTNVI